MSAKGHNRNTASTDSSITKCVEEVNTLGKELSKLRSDFLHSQDILPATLRTQNMEITNKNKEALLEHKAETNKMLTDLRDYFKKQNADTTKKWDDKFANLVASTDNKIAEIQKSSQKRIDDLEAEVNKNRASVDTTLINLRGEFKKGDTQLDQQIIEVEDKLEKILKQLHDLNNKLKDEANARDGVKSDLASNSEQLSNSIDELKNYLKEVMDKKNNEIDELAEKFDGTRKNISSCEVKADQISQSLQSTEEKGNELSTDLKNIEKRITDLGINMNAQLSKIPDEIDQKIQVQSNHYTNMLNDAKNDNAAQFNALTNSVNDLTGHMNGKFAQSLEANHALAQQANDSIIKFTDQQNNLKNLIDELENTITKKHTIAIQQIDEVRNLNHETQKDLQDLSSSMLSNLRVKRQVSEFNSGSLTPQMENGDFH